MRTSNGSLLSRFLLLTICLLALVPTFALALQSPEPAATSSAPKIDTGDTAWLLVSTALVLLMTPGLALFYGGMVRRKNVLGTMMQSFILVALVSILWAFYG